MRVGTISNEPRSFVKDEPRCLPAVWACMVQVWRDDEGALNRTMAEIDKRLKQMRERLKWVAAGF